jgi:hypothetical protein
MGLSIQFPSPRRQAVYSPHKRLVPGKAFPGLEARRRAKARDGLAKPLTDAAGFSVRPDEELEVIRDLF